MKFLLPSSMQHDGDVYYPCGMPHSFKDEWGYVKDYIADDNKRFYIVYTEKQISACIAIHSAFCPYTPIEMNSY